MARTLGFLIPLILDEGGSPDQEVGERAAIVQRLGIVEIVDLRTADQPVAAVPVS